MVGIFFFVLLITLSVLKWMDDSNKKERREELTIEREKESFYRSATNEMKKQDYKRKLYSMNMFEKLLYGDPIQMLFMGDEINQLGTRYKNRFSWQEELVDGLNSKFNSDINDSTIIYRGANILWPYLQLKMDYADIYFDTAVIEMKEELFADMDGSETEKYLNKIIHLLYNQNSNVSIIFINKLQLPSSVLLVEEFVKRYAFVSLVEENSDNSQGLRDYIDRNIAEVDRNKSYILQAKNEVDVPFESELFYMTRSVKSKGFLIDEHRLKSYRSDSYLDFVLRCKSLYISYITFPRGGSFQIYIDENLYGTYNTYGMLSGIGTVLVKLDGNEHLIRIKALESSDKEQYIMIHFPIVDQVEK